MFNLRYKQPNNTPFIKYFFEKLLLRFLNNSFLKINSKYKQK